MDTTYDIFDYINANIAFMESLDKKENFLVLKNEDKVLSVRKEKVNIFKMKSIFDITYGGLAKSKRPFQYICARAYSTISELVQHKQFDDLPISKSFTYALTPNKYEKISRNLSETELSNTFSVTSNILYEGERYSIGLSNKLQHKYHLGYVINSTPREYLLCTDIFFGELIILSAIEEEFQTLLAGDTDELYQSILVHRLCNDMDVLRRYKNSFDICDESKEFISNFNREDYAYNIGGFLAMLKDCKSIALLQKTGILTNLFSIMLREYQIDKEEQDREKSDYAKSYETKKNISKAVQKAMEESLFHKHFGFVEFDNETDLKKIKKIEKEFDALSKILNQGYLEDYTIRFRKLGKIKAYGCYFPRHKCLCIDLDGPSSIVHEYFHLLDFHYGKLSRTYSFEPVISAYTKAIEEEVSKDPDLKKKWNGKTKYNSSYYLQPSEIFARCGEMYLAKILNVNNSLLDYSSIGELFKYPNDEALLSAIKTYFDKVKDKIGLCLVQNAS